MKTDNSNMLQASSSKRDDSLSNGIMKNEAPSMLKLETNSVLFLLGGLFSLGISLFMSPVIRDVVIGLHLIVFSCLFLIPYFLRGKTMEKNQTNKNDQITTGDKSTSDLMNSLGSPIKDVLRELADHEDEYQHNLGESLQTYEAFIDEKLIQEPRGQKRDSSYHHDNDMVHESLNVLKDMIYYAKPLYRQHKEFGQNLRQFISSQDKSVSSFNKIMADFGCDIEKTYPEYWKQYSLLRGKLDLSMAMSSNHDEKDKNISIMINDLDSQYREKTQKSGILLNLLAEPISKVSYYEKLFGKLSDIFYQEKESRELFQCVDKMLTKISEIKHENNMLLDNLFQLEKIYELKKKLQLPNLGSETTEILHDRSSMSIPRTPRFIHEGTLYQIKYQREANVEVGKEKVLSTDGPFSAYLFDNTLILAEFDSNNPNVTTRTKVYHLPGRYVEKSVSINGSYKHAFSLHNVGSEYHKVFSTSSDEDLQKWLRCLSQVLDPKPTLTRKDSKRIERSLIESTEEDGIQVYYATPLEELYKNKHLWENFEKEDTEQNIEYIEGKKMIRCATLEKLIQKLTSPTDIDKNNHFLFAFLLTYRSFTTPQGLLEMLINRFNTPPSNPNISMNEFKVFKMTFLFPVRLRICQTIEHWIEKHAYDFRSNSKCSDQAETLEEQGELVSLMLQFIEGHIAKSGLMKSAAQQLKESLMKQAKRRDTFIAQKQNYIQKQLKALNATITNTTSKVPKPKVPRPLRAFSGKQSVFSAKISDQQKAFSMPLTEWPSLEIARQLTLIEFSLFERILPKECLNQAWNKKNRQEKAPNIYEIIERTNIFINYIAMQILNYEKLSQRVHALRKFIKVAKECRLLNNFNAVFEIVGALNSIAIHRLKKTWEGIPQKLMEEFKKLETFVSQQKNFRNMRDAMKRTLPPCIPYVGLYLTDLTFIEDGNPDLINGKINFFKREKLSVVIREIQTFQKTPYSLQSVPELSNKLKNMTVISEDKLIEISNKLEPPKY